MAIILYTLFIASILPIVLSAIGLYLRKRQFGSIDNDYPRQQQAQLTGLGLRATAAQQNAWEALSIYSAVVVIAYASGLELSSLDIPALIFISCRILHAVFYLLNLATLRSVIFAVAMLSCIYIVILAAQQLP